MTPFELEQRRASRQLKVFEAARMVRRIMGWPDSKPGSDAERIEEVRQASLAAIAEARATMHALQVKGIATEAEVQDWLDWGYDSVLAQLSAGNARKVVEAEHG